MSQILMDFLLDSFLFNPSHVNENYKSIPESELEKETARYRDYCNKNIEVIWQKSDPKTTTSATVEVRSIKDLPDLPLLKQAALYIHNLNIRDPIYDSCRIATNRYFRKGSLIGEDKKIDREDLAKSCKYVKSLQYAVADGYVRFTPYVTSEKDHIPITYSPTQFSERVPEELKKWFSENTVVSNIHLHNEGLLVDSRELKPGRRIALGFKGDIEPIIQFFELSEVEVMHHDESTGIISTRMWVPDDIPDSLHFESWVEQSKNQTAGNFISRLAGVLEMCAYSKSMLLTRSPFVSKILDLSIDKRDESVSVMSSNAMMKMDLPMLDELPLKMILSIRANETDSFENFRVFLDEKSLEIDRIGDPVLRDKEIKYLSKQLNEVEIRKIDLHVKQIRSKFLKDRAKEAVLTVGMGFSTWSTSPFISSAIAGVYGVASLLSLLEARKLDQYPGTYFLWALQKQIKRQ